MPENLHPLSIVVLAAHWLIVIGLSLRVITRRLPVGVSLAWLAVLFSGPLLVQLVPSRPVPYSDGIRKLRLAATYSAQDAVSLLGPLL